MVALALFCACSANKGGAPPQPLLEADYDDFWSGEYDWRISIYDDGSVHETRGQRRRVTRLAASRKQALEVVELASRLLPQIEGSYPAVVDDAPDAALTLRTSSGTRRLVVGSIFDRPCDPGLVLFGTVWNQVISLAPPRHGCSSGPCKLLCGQP
jgi:hypothetical protein